MPTKQQRTRSMTSDQSREKERNLSMALMTVDSDAEIGIFRADFNYRICLITIFTNTGDIWSNFTTTRKGTGPNDIVVQLFKGRSADPILWISEFFSLGNHRLLCVKFLGIKEPFDSLVKSSFCIHRGDIYCQRNSCARLNCPITILKQKLEMW